MLMNLEGAQVVWRAVVLQKEIPIHSILSAATDGTPPMTGRHKGFIAR